MIPDSDARADGSVRRIFRVPAVLALVSTIGLLSALLGDDLWDALSWLTLGAPLAVIAWFVARPARD